MMPCRRAQPSSTASGTSPIRIRSRHVRKRFGFCHHAGEEQSCDERDDRNSAAPWASHCVAELSLRWPEKRTEPDENDGRKDTSIHRLCPFLACSTSTAS